MGKGKSSAPAAPDPYKTAQAEAQFNRLDTYSPAGSGVRYGYTDPATGQFVQGVTPQGAQSAVKQLESPWEASIRELLQPASVGLTDRIVADNITNMPDAPRVQDRGDVAKNIFDRSFSMMKPAIDKANTRLLTNLQARGIPIGAEAFNDAYGEQQRNTEQTIANLALDADNAAGSEQSRLFGLDAASRQGSIAELVAAMGGNYNPPSATPSGNAAGVNYGGLVGQKYQADMAQYEANQAQKSSTMSTLGSLGGAMLMKSSRDAKFDDGTVPVHDVAAKLAHLPIHQWRYKPGHAPAGFGDETHIGPMAQDFQQAFGVGDGQFINAVDAFGVVFAALKSALLRIEVLERRHYGEAVN